ncbi:MAG: prepilin peptidase [Patescibacteria group bacterium]
MILPLQEITAYNFSLFIFGLAIGSFLNVLSLRYDPDKFLFSLKNLRGRSHCPHCKKILRWHELIPLFSFFIQLGRCRGCLVKIGWQYPIVEFLTGLAFLIPIYIQGPLWFSVIWVLAAILLILMSVIDYRLYLIPDEIIIGLSLLGILLAGLKLYYQNFLIWNGSFLKNYSLLIMLPGNIFWRHILTAVICGLLFLLIVLVTKGRGMGVGDVKLAGAIGLLMGSPDAFLALALSFVIGSVVGLFLMAFGRKKFKEPIPFGPHMVLGVFIVMFFGYQILDFYFHLFG